MGKAVLYQIPGLDNGKRGAPGNGMAPGGSVRVLERGGGGVGGWVVAVVGGAGRTAVSPVGSGGSGVHSLCGCVLQRLRR
jgi:hypothetical protein